MLQKVINPGGREIEFYYDPLGRRTAKIVKQRHSDSALAGEESPSTAQDAVTRFVWDGNVPLHEWKYTGQYAPQKAIDEEGIKEEKRTYRKCNNLGIRGGKFCTLC